MFGSQATVFRNARAVDAWDQWFRWRAEGRLRDVTVDDTWARVARALVASSPLNGDYWANRYGDAFSRWRLLPNPLWLRHAGTPLQAREPHPGCVVNLAAHVVRTPSGPTLDEDGLADSASLAVRLVDDILCATPDLRPFNAEIGIIGLGSAVHALEQPYDGAGARAFARRCLKLISGAAWSTSARLAAERGPLVGIEAGARSTLLRRELPPSVLETIERTGLRFRRLTRTTLQPLLAQLAGVTDALQAAPPLPDAPVASELRMRACLQPWIDEPIDLPVMVPSDTTEDLERCARIARRLRVPMPFLEKGGVSNRPTAGD